VFHDVLLVGDNDITARGFSTTASSVPERNALRGGGTHERRTEQA